MKSLKDNLLSLLRAKGTLSYADAVSFSMSEGYKVDNMTRRMRELCHEQPIVPITAISKRNTEYISGWKMKFRGYDTFLSARKGIPSRLENGTLVINGVYYPVFAPKKESEPQSPLFP